MTAIPTTHHQWEATGVSGYPIRHPIVGQGSFHRKLKNFLRLVDTPDNAFAHVFAAVAPWGVGKSRLGYEVVAQVNDTSQGWKVRDEMGNLVDAHLFNTDTEREQYLALYIRYSQIAHEQLHLDNWLAPGLYKALVPLARGKFDRSIQHQVAQQAYERLLVKGFEPAELATAMELDQHSEDDLYRDTELATRLCTAAYDVLANYGIQYVMVVLDELETAAERANAGLSAEEARTMDGKAITLLRKAVEVPTLGQAEITGLSKAIKEEDARARFPWLRYLALCSPAIGDELKEVESTNRRFEIIDLEPNAFADVSTFVESLDREGRLLRSYPQGLVEAAYMMSNGNFGWFNVIMAAVDQAMEQISRPEAPISEVFQRAILCSERVGRYILDARSIDELNLPRELESKASDLLFGQQPISIDQIGNEPAQLLLKARNSFGEPVAIGYQRVRWHRNECSQLLIQARGQRQSGTGNWTLPGIPEAINLEHLLDNLATLAVREGAVTLEGDLYTLLLPQIEPGFLQLLDLIYPHPAVEDVGRILWAGLMGESRSEAIPTHIGPSIDMLRRLDIRLRKASTDAILRSPAENQAYSLVVERLNRSEREQRQDVLTGIMRLLDEHWDYDPVEVDGEASVVAMRTDKHGLRDFKGLSLNPKELVVLAWANSDTELENVLGIVATVQEKEGCCPVLVFTSDYGLPDRFATANKSIFKKARGFAQLINLNSSELNALEQVGLPREHWDGFRLHEDRLTNRFNQRLNRIKGSFARNIRDWRHRLSGDGRIAWPIRPSGVLKEPVFNALIEGWKTAIVDYEGQSLEEIGRGKETGKLDFDTLLPAIDSLGLSTSAGPRGYREPEDTAQFWLGQQKRAKPELPPLLVYGIVGWLRQIELDLDPTISVDKARENWLWGYLWDNNKLNTVFDEWMTLAQKLHWVQPAKDEASGRKKNKPYTLVSLHELEGKLNEAKNYLDRKYPELYQDLLGVFGDGVIFKITPGKGPRYERAKSQLKDAEQALEELKAYEGKPFNKDWFLKATQLRIQFCRALEQVYVEETQQKKLAPAQLDPQISFDDNTKPFWERVNQVSQFAEYVTSIATRIREKVPAVQETIRSYQGDTEGGLRFPTNLFVRPLSKVLDTVDAGMEGLDPFTSSERSRNAHPETLAYYLRDLRTQDAFRELEKLGREVGVSVDPRQDVANAESISGYIMQGFRELQRRYQSAKDTVLDLQVRLETLETTLASAPDDFSMPENAQLDELSGQPELIADDLEIRLSEDVDELLDRYDSSMKLGNFEPLMRESLNTLLNPSEAALRTLVGKVRTLENAVQDYRKKLLERETAQDIRQAYNKLRQIKGRPEISPPNMADLEKQKSLRDAQIYLRGQEEVWREEGAKILEETGVSFQEWMATLNNLAHPPITPEQLDSLVCHGFLIRTYGLPGGGA
ncbi:hypothetical protein IQ273_24370 [Nodosilinea sp. LEGE 07298]|uniref:hypothetical protein n=1 Tax=Nodosilinea sp. LEGE 07298 TaxID=2777970 RepID=UPI00187F7FE9|nr:hypothetical protein [Nodosilinea sp. LEGE 07298]MBE9112533.1 hypothetical protein [Nodosilinea sp. LEGE 07298]